MVTMEELVDELGKVLWDRDLARVVLERAGFGPADIPSIGHPVAFWHEAIAAARNGRSIGGVRALVEKAANFHPANPVFARYLAATEGQAVTPAPEALGALPGRPRGRYASDSPELLVTAERDGARVRLSYRIARRSSASLPPREVTWDPALDDAARTLASGDGEALRRLGLRLGRALLGAAGEPGHHALMRVIFEVQSLDEATTPLAGSVRCRLALDEALEALPWRLAAVEDADAGHHWLVEEEWTFEHGFGERAFERVELRQPCHVLLLVPQHGPLYEEGARLVTEVKDVLAGTWGLDAGQIGSWVVPAYGRHDALATARRLGVDVVVCLARALVEPTTSLELCRDGGVKETVSLARLVEELAAAKVKLLLLATPQAVTLPMEARGRLPCVVVPTVPASPREASATAVAWLQVMLAEGLDPVRALHRPPLAGPTRRWCGMQAHTHYHVFGVPPAQAAHDDRRARLCLDRDELRGLFMRHVGALVQDDRRMVEAFLVDGGVDDHVELLGEQLWEEHRGSKEAAWGMTRTTLDLPVPTARRSLDDQLDRILVQALAVEVGGSPRGALEAEARSRGWPGRPFVYWLDFGAELQGIEGEALAAWVRLVMQRLARLVEGFRHVRVIATLGVVPSDRDRFRRVATQLLGELGRGQPTGHASITTAALGLVTVAHIRRHLEDRRRCPLELVQAVAEEIHRVTAGVFAQVIARVEQLEANGGWREFAGACPAAVPVTSIDLSGRL